LVVDKRSGSVQFLETTRGRTKKKTKSEEISTIAIGEEKYRMRFHFPTSSWHLIDLGTAKEQADSRLRLVGAEWTAAQSLGERASVDDANINFLKEASNKIGNGTVQVVENELIALLTDLTPPEIERLQATMPKLFETLNVLFGVPSGQTVLPGRPLIAAFRDRESFASFASNAMEFRDFGNAGTFYRLSPGRFVVASNFRVDEKRFIWDLVWCMSGAFASTAYSSVEFPDWLAVGLRQTTADAMVPSVHDEKREREDVISSLQFGTLDGLFEATRIEPRRHVVPEAVVRFLKNRNRIAFTQALLDIKAGVPVAKSIEINYGLTMEELARQFGAEYGFPQLKP
jgi:hypothetical protein